MASSTKKTGGLSASEALKAAEAAIGGESAKPAPKPAAVKAKAPAAKAAPKPKVTANPKAAAPKAAAKPKAPAVPEPVAPEPAPAAVIAATTAVDAAPEPIEPVEPVAPVEPPVAKTKAKPVQAKAEPKIVAPLPMLEGTKTMNDMIETGKKFAEDAKAKLESVYADLNEKTKAGVEKSTKAIEEMSDLAKGNVEALVESGKIAAKGFEEMGQEAVDYSRKNLEKATATFKSFSTVKTPTEFFQLQSALISSSFDEFTKEAAKSSEAMMKLAGDVAAPLTARVTLVTDKVKALAA